MKLSALLAPLLDAKADHEMIRKQILAFEAEAADALERRRQSDAARQARKRERDDKSRDVTLRHSDRSLTGAGVTRGSDKTSKLDIEPQVKKETPRAALALVLDEARTDAVIEHRERIRKPLTTHAAKLLAGKFAKCADPNDAADKMVGNGWTGFEPAWMDRPTARGPPSQKSGGIGSVFDELDRRFENGQDHSGGDDQAPQGVVLSLPYRSAGR